MNPWRPDTETLGKVFPLAVPTDPSLPWEMKKWQPDLAVIMAGGNDWVQGSPVDDGPPTLEAFTGAYRQFVAMLRTTYPSAHLLMTISPGLRDDQIVDRPVRTYVLSAIKTIASERNAQGDLRSYWFEPGESQPGEMTACDGHGNPAVHLRIATEIASFIKPKVGW